MVLFVWLNGGRDRERERGEREREGERERDRERDAGESFPGTSDLLVQPMKIG